MNRYQLYRARRMMRIADQSFAEWIAERVAAVALVAVVAAVGLIDWQLVVVAGVGVVGAGVWERRRAKGQARDGGSEKTGTV